MLTGRCFGANSGRYVRWSVCPGVTGSASGTARYAVMHYTLVFTEQYNRKAAKFIKKHPELRQQYLKTLHLLKANPFHPSLRLHPLQGKHDGLHSVSINLSYSITLELLIQDERIIPVNVGDNDAVY
jgi:toxin HigB-1